MERVREHDYEPVPGLPERLPQGETILWQGRPSASRIAVEALKVRWIAFYFLLLAGWAVAAGVSDGRTWPEILFSASVLGILGAIVIGLIELYAWAVERTSLYTITSKRVVMRVGVGSSVTFNLPYQTFAAASLLTRKDGSGTICFELAGKATVSGFHLWPHVRPRRWSKPQPALRCIVDAARVATILVEQMKGSQDAVAEPVASAPQSVRKPRTPAAAGAAGAAHA